MCAFVVWCLPPFPPCLLSMICLPSLCVVSRDGASAPLPVIVAVRPSWPLSFVLLFHRNMWGSWSGKVTSRSVGGCIAEFETVRWGGAGVKES
jgi:hypothetical protein